jgi:hypothetical protein
MSEGQFATPIVIDSYVYNVGEGRHARALPHLDAVDIGRMIDAREQENAS